MRLRLPTRNFYPRPPRGGRHDLRAGQGPRSEISIHALREEGDGSQPDALTVQTISIHALREEGDLIDIVHAAAGEISIHALREEGDNPGSPQHWFYLISIHALREEGDPTRPRAFSSTSDFYPRPPRGGRPLHAPVLRLRGNFYPRPPRGGRHNTEAVKLLLKEFLSTPSARRATDRP